MWEPKMPYKPESQKVVWEVVQYLKGEGCDIGAGMFRVLPQALTIDNGNHEQFGHHIDPNIRCRSADCVPVISDRYFDWVYSSHLLEHMEDPLKALKEWWRILKPKGVLVLYLPHEDLYPKVGTEGANPDHKHDLSEQKLIDWMVKVGGWDLERCEQRNENDEYSFLMVFRKLEGKKHQYSYKKPKYEGKTACVVRYGAF